MSASAPRYSSASLREFASEALRAVGVPPGDADQTADNLIAGNLTGVDTHGVTRVLIPYIRRIQHGMMLPTTAITVLRERPATALLDGGNGIGQVIAERAMRLAVEKAALCGSGWVAVRNSNHFGAAGYFARMGLEQDVIGLVATNGPAAVAPTGGRMPMVSTNPLAVAIPAGEEPPIVLDMATTVVSRGRINLFAKQGKPIPEGWALDERGRPTTDALAALRGSLLPMAGYKGYGLSLVIDALCGVLAGANFGAHFPGHLAEYGVPPQNVGSLFAAVSVESFAEPAEFRARMDQALREIKASPRAEGVDRIYTPGEIEHETRLARLRDGIPMPPEVDAELRGLAEELGVRYPDPV